MCKSKEDHAAKECEFFVNLAIENENMMKSFKQKLQEERSSFQSDKETEITKERESILRKFKENRGLYQQQLKENNNCNN